MTYMRPDLPYDNNAALPNTNRYSLLSDLKLPPTAQMFDADFNYLIDSDNDLQLQIDNLAAGSLPGSSDPLNANRLLTTDGAGNILWVQVTNQNLSNACIDTNNYIDSSITTPKIQNGAITKAKISSLVPLPFSAGRVGISGGVGTVLSGVNFAGISQLGTGYWRVLFSAPATNSNYVVLFGSEGGRNNIPKTLFKPSYQNTTPVSFEVTMQNLTEGAQSFVGFSFMVMNI